MDAQNKLPSALISRRVFLASSAAAVAVASVVPMSLPSAAVSEPSATAAPKQIGSWGYSLDQEGWSTGFASLEEARSMIAEDEAGYVGFCVPYDLSCGDVGDAVVEWLADRPHQSLGDHLAQAFEFWNEDNDWEGDLAAAISGEPTDALNEQARTILLTSLRRLALFDVIDAIGADPLAESDEPYCEDDGALLLIGRDKQLEAELESCILKWADTEEIRRAPRLLHIDREQFVAAVPEVEGL